ncbi:cell division protein, partial [Lactobacillus mulieris]|nr:cell division protein [Lactobacillus mulieris]MCZ3624599.1 cell division protein [Lactobacillus mulieris]MCZ3636930.1 cell division protein [Lactobacillus mulieris]MCZ3690884.1 cell division protein [Lactobacillus mulieris]MCZ3702869.1 cell division protein [Lactobacillus mulieris]
NLVVKKDKNQLNYQSKKATLSTLTFTYKAKPNSVGYIVLDNNQLYTTQISKLTVNNQEICLMPITYQPIGVYVPKSGKVTLKIKLKKEI